MDCGLEELKIAMNKLIEAEVSKSTTIKAKEKRKKHSEQDWLPILDAIEEAQAKIVKEKSLEKEYYSKEDLLTEEKLEKYSKFITDKNTTKIGDKVIYRESMEYWSKFVNPFNGKTVHIPTIATEKGVNLKTQEENDRNKILSAMYYNWVVKDEVPKTYTGTKEQLDQKRRDILQNLFKIEWIIENEGKFYSNTFDEKIHPANTLLYIADLHLSNPEIFEPTNKDLKNIYAETDKLPFYQKDQVNNTYAGIGSRETPKEILKEMTKIGQELESKGYTLRSGGAIGADKAFEGANQNNGKDYTKLIRNLEDRVKGYTKFVTTDKNAINTMRGKINGKFGNFGNPFSKWTVTTSDDGELSAMYYDWIVNNNIPTTFLSEKSNQERTKGISDLIWKRNNVIKNLKGAAGQDLYYEGTAKDKNLSHASVLALMADLYKKGKLKIDPNKKQNILESTLNEEVKNKEIYLAEDATPKTLKIAEEIHPKWSNVKKDKDKNLMARNTFQVFGKNLDNPVDFVIFYALEQDGIRPLGGTGQAVQLARMKGIPTINMAEKGWQNKIKALYKKIGKKDDETTLNIFYDTNENANLSNLAVRPFTYQKKKYQSVEHAYQTLKGGPGKADKQVYEKDWSKGGLVKRGGKGTNTKDNWNLGLMKLLVKKSFEQNPEAKEELLATKNKVLTHTQGDKTWSKMFPKTLMIVRDELRDNTKNPKPTTKTQGWITRQDLRDNPNTQYIFGDNLDKKGYGGQAKEMRGEPNAIGIPTKKKPSKKDDAYFTDEEFEANVKAIDMAINKIDTTKDMILPEKGIGTDLADTANKAPKTWNYLTEKMNEIAGFEWLEPVEVTVETDNALKAQNKNKKTTDNSTNFQKVVHYTNVPINKFNFATFKKEKKNINQFGDGLNVFHGDSNSLGSRYGKNRIVGYIDLNRFPTIDASKSGREIHKELTKLGYKFNSTSEEYYNTKSLSEEPGDATLLFEDFTENNKEVPGVTILNHSIAKKKIDKFHVIYDSKAFYGDNPENSLPTATYNNTLYTYDKENNRLFTKNKDVDTTTVHGKKVLELFGIKEKHPTTQKKIENKYELFKGVEANEDQKVAIDRLGEFINNNTQTSILVKGRGGTGKTSIISKVLKNSKIPREEIHYITPTNKATKVLKQMAVKNNTAERSEFLTVAQALSYIMKNGTLVKRTDKRGKVKKPLILGGFNTKQAKVLVVDEASMLTSNMITELENTAKKNGIKIIYMGDNVQLPPIEINPKTGKNILQSKVFDNHNNQESKVELNKRMRQSEDSNILPITDVLAESVESRISEDGLTVTPISSHIDPKFSIKNFEDLKFKKRVIGTIKDFVTDLKENPTGTRWIMFNNNNHFEGKNLTNKVREYLFGKEQAKKEYVEGEQLYVDNPMYIDKKEIFSTGDELTVLKVGNVKNTAFKIEEWDNSIKRFVGKVYKIPAREIQVKDNLTNDIRIVKVKSVESEKTLKVLSRNAVKGIEEQLMKSSSAYVLTSHKAQGSTYEKVYADIQNIFKQGVTLDSLKSAYVATSRPSKELVMVGVSPSMASQTTTIVKPESKIKEDNSNIGSKRKQDQQSEIDAKDLCK